MKSRSVVSGIFAATALFLVPAIGFSLTSQFTDRINSVAQSCVDDSSTCSASVLPLLSDVRANTSGEQYDHEIGTFVLAIIAAFENMPTPSAEECGLLADTLEDLALSALDQSQADQIMAIAGVVRNCNFVGFDTDRLLASPN